MQKLPSTEPTAHALDEPVKTYGCFGSALLWIASIWKSEYLGHRPNDTHVTEVQRWRCGGLETMPSNCCLKSTQLPEPVLNGVEYWQCEAWRAEVLQRIVDDPPELVVISNLAETNGQGSADDLGYWEEGLGELLALIHTRVVVIADTPRFNFTPSVCLSDPCTMMSQ